MSEISVCPECDSANIQHNHTNGYRCWDCEAAFHRPRYRQSNGTNNTLYGLAKDLDEADPDEVSR